MLVMVLYLLCDRIAHLSYWSSGRPYMYIRIQTITLVTEVPYVMQLLLYVRMRCKQLPSHYQAIAQCGVCRLNQ